MMEFLDPKKRLAHRKKLFLGYGLIAIALAMTTIIIVFAAYGFDIDRKTGDVIQNGMMIIDSHPESARISVNGRDEGNTSKRLSVPAGQYHIELSRDGYRNWKQDVNLAGSSIEQLVYPFLFPSTLSTKNIQTYSAQPPLVSQSPDRQWLLTQQPGDASGAFQLIDLNDKTNPSTTIVLPAGVASAGTTQNLEVVEWSTNNSDVLLKRTYDGKTEFLVLNRENVAASRNVTTAFPGRPFTAVTLRDKRADQFYLYNSADKTLYSADTKTGSATQVASGVLDYKSYQKELVLYVTAANDTSKADVHLLYKGKDKVIKTVAVSPTYLLDAADFTGKMYVAVGSSNEGKLYLFANPLDSYGGSLDETPKTFRALSLNGAQFVSFSNNARFVSVQSGSSFAVYDAETNRQFKFDTKVAVAPSVKASWMDGHRLTFIGTDNATRVFDFDGTNLQSLSPGFSGTGVYFDRDYTALFTMAPGKDEATKAALTRTELKVTQ